MKTKKINIAIDASRSKSGGGVSHMKGIITDLDLDGTPVEKVHVWGYQKLLNALPERPWLVKHGHPLIEKSLPYQLWWQYKILPKLMKENRCDILLSTDAGTVLIYHPSVVMSRDMLSFEKSEIKRYGISKAWLRLFLLRFVQIRSLKNADGTIFLTKYAADTITQWSGKITDYRIIPHGVSQTFKQVNAKAEWHSVQKQPIQCLYVSNTALYKHQWHVVEAISRLRFQGYNLKLKLVGGGHGKSKRMLDDAIQKFDPDRHFVVTDSFVPQDQLPEILSEAHIFIFASSCENMPNTLVEAMSVGLPIACSDRGPMPEVLQDGGVYFDPENPESIADALKKILNDENMRNQLKEKAKNLANRYSWARCARETIQYLVDIYFKTHNSKLE